MPHKLTLEMVPAGYAVESAQKEGTSVLIQTREFTSSEDGYHFVSRLEGFPEQILKRADKAHRPTAGAVDHLLAVIHKDRSAIVYINELCLDADVRLRRKVALGNLIARDEICDVTSVRIAGVDIPPTAGVLFLFSVGWRKGLYYDLNPLQGACQEREYNLQSLFGQYYTYLLFQDLFRIDDSEWDRLINQQWFPFASLKHATKLDMVSRVREGWNVDELLERVHADTLERLEDATTRWKANAYFEGHADLLSRALERFRNGDYMSATALIYPRIEGILRSLRVRISPSASSTQAELVDCAADLATSQCHAMSALLPERFRRYLREVYFAKFSPNAPDIRLSRNSVAHGVAKQEDFSLKASCIGFLIIEQLWHYLKPSDAQIQDAHAGAQGYHMTMRWRDNGHGFD